METTYQNDENGLHNEQLILTAESVSYLQKIAKWTTFFSIVGFVFIGIMVVLGLVMTIFMTSVFAAAGKPQMAYIGLLYVVFATIYIIPVIYLYRFSTIAKKAIRNSDMNDITIALKNLKSHFKFMGILTIVILALYLIIGIGFAVVKLVM